MNKFSNFPGKWVICDCCEGNGKHGFDRNSGGIDSDSWAEMQNEYDDQTGESLASCYLSGAYDVTCTECGGSGKVKDVDFSQCTFTQKRVIVEAKRRAAWQAEAEADRRNGS